MYIYTYYTTFTYTSVHVHAYIVTCKYIQAYVSTSSLSTCTYIVSTNTVSYIHIGRVKLWKQLDPKHQLLCNELVQLLRIQALLLKKARGYRALEKRFEQHLLRLRFVTICNYIYLLPSTHLSYPTCNIPTCISTYMPTLCTYNIHLVVPHLIYLPTTTKA